MARTVTPPSSGTDPVEIHRQEQLRAAAAGLARGTASQLQYLGDDARFLTEAVGDLVAAVSWYRSCVRVLAKGHPTLSQELEAMEGRLDLDELMHDMPQAVDQVKAGLSQLQRTLQALQALAAEDEQGTCALEEVLEQALLLLPCVRGPAVPLQRRLPPGLPRLRIQPGQLQPLLIEALQIGSRCVRPEGWLQATAHAKPGLVVLELLATPASDSDPDADQADSRLLAILAHGVAGSSECVRLAGAMRLQLILPALSGTGTGSTHRHASRSDRGIP